MERNPKKAEKGFDTSKYRDESIFRTSGEYPQLYRNEPEVKPELQTYTPKWNRVVNPDNAKKVASVLTKIAIKLLEIMGYLVVVIFMFVVGLFMGIIDAFRTSNAPSWDNHDSWNNDYPCESKGSEEITVEVKVKIKK